MRITTVFFILLLASCCKKTETKSELLIGKWCITSEFTTQAGWYDSDQFTIEFSENGSVKIINKDAQNNCESTFEFDEQNNQINSPKNCAKFILELVDDQTLILYNQGREGVYKYKFTRC